MKLYGNIKKFNINNKKMNKRIKRTKLKKLLKTFL